MQNGRKAERLRFATLEPHGHPYLQFTGERIGGGNGTPLQVAVSVGPQYGTVSAGWVKEAAREALKGQGFDLLVICGFAFDAHVSETAAEFGPGNNTDFAAVHAEKKMGRLPVLLVRMNAELAMGDAVLKKTGTANLFTMFGEPDIAVDHNADGDVRVRLRGVDVYNPTTGEIRSSSTDEIALWMIDTDYDSDSFFVRHCYFSGGGTDPYQRLRRALRADIDEDAWASVYRTESRPFPKPSSGRIAVKVINHYGDEVLKVIEVS